MHDLPTIYALTHDVIHAQSCDLFDSSGNTLRYPNPPKLFDVVGVGVGVGVGAEALGRDAEPQLFATLRDYSELLPGRGSRQRFNARRRLIGPLDDCLAALSAFLDQNGDHLVVDSMPIPTASVARGRAASPSVMPTARTGYATPPRATTSSATSSI